MIQTSGERYIEARCEQVWMVVDDENCRARWLSFADQIEGITVYEPSTSVTFSTQEHPSLAHMSSEDCAATLTVELIPEGAGTRGRLLAVREPSGRLRAIAMKLTAHRALERHISVSLDQLAQMLAGRTAG
jgi:carbon monoxide dehydrogenase subunit G